MTDMTDVWIDETTEEEIVKRALRLCISSLEDSLARANFLVCLDEQFANGEARVGKVKGEHIVISTQIDSIIWDCNLKKALSSQKLEFFQELCMLSFSNHRYLLHHIGTLERTLRARDKYALYLEENYKTVNGSELIRKYKRQHLADAPHLERYDRNLTQRETRVLYQASQDKWELISDIVADKTAWNGEFQTLDLGHVKVEPVSMKREPDEDNEEVKTSPNKRRRVGMIRR